MAGEPAPPVYTAPTPAAIGEGTANPAAGMPAPPPSASPQRSAADLEQLAAPIALYPDSVIAVMLPAAVYPLEIVQAARFVRDTNNLAKLDAQPWDENVKAVARIPTLIKKMDDEISWTSDLGQAFIDQPSELMDAIQTLRTKATSAGTLRTTEQQVVVVTNLVVERTYEQQVVYVTNTVVQIQPANPQVIYVPQYSPTVVYVAPPDPMVPVVTFGVGLAIGAIIANNHCDWGYGGCYHGHYPPPPPYYPPPYHPPPGAPRPPPAGRPPGAPPPGSRPPANRPPGNGPPGNPPPGGPGQPSQRWQPDQSRLRSSGAPGSAQTREARGWGGGDAVSQRPAVGTGSSLARPSQLPAGSPGGARPAQQPSLGTSQRPAANTPRPSTPVASQRPASAPSRPASSPSAGGAYNRPAPSNSAFSGVNSGSSARQFSNRGSSSRGGGFSGGRGGGGRGR
jgi:hypothetical protein